MGYETFNPRIGADSVYIPPTINPDVLLEFIKTFKIDHAVIHCVNGIEVQTPGETTEDVRTSPNQIEQQTPELKAATSSQFEILIVFCKS